MISNELKLEGRRLFYESYVFGKKYIVHQSDHNHRLHCYMEGHINLFKHYSASPRMFFTATQGSSGKTTCLYKSSFFVPLMDPGEPLVTDCGAGYLRELNDYVEDNNNPIPAVLYEEAQEALQDNSGVAYRILHTYRSGAKRIIYDGSKNLKQRLYFPCMIDGLINKYKIHPNFIERCISIKMLKRIPGRETEKVEDFELDELIEEIGDTMRTPRIQWASKITKDDIVSVRNTVKDDLVKRGIENRERQLMRPLIEYAYLVDDYDAALLAADDFANKAEIIVELSEDQQLIIDIYELFDESGDKFIGSMDLCNRLKNLVDKPWSTYGRKGNGINPSDVASILRSYDIEPTHNEDKSMRGYHKKKFNSPRERILNNKFNEGHEGQQIQQGQPGRPTSDYVNTPGMPIAIKLKDLRGILS